MQISSSFTLAVHVNVFEAHLFTLTGSAGFAINY